MHASHRPQVNHAYPRTDFAYASFVNDAQIPAQYSRVPAAHITRIWRVCIICKWCTDSGTRFMRTWRAFHAHVTRTSNFFFAPFWKFCPIFKILPHFQNFDSFSKFWPIFKFFDTFSNFWPIFKILTLFPNFDPFSKVWHIFKLLPHFKLLTYFTNIDKLTKRAKNCVFCSKNTWFWSKKTGYGFGGYPRPPFYGFFSAKRGLRIWGVPPPPFKTKSAK